MADVSTMSEEMERRLPSRIRLCIRTGEGVIGDILVDPLMSTWRVRSEMSVRGFLASATGDQKVIVVGSGRSPTVLPSSLSATLADIGIKQGDSLVLLSSRVRPPLPSPPADEGTPDSATIDAAIKAYMQESGTWVELPPETAGTPMHVPQLEPPPARHVEQLVEMGFSLEWAMVGLSITRNSVNAAAEWLLENQEGLPPQPPSGGEGGGVEEASR